MTETTADVPENGNAEGDLPVRRQAFGMHRIAVRVGVELGSASLKLSDLMAFRDGTIIELDNDIDAPMALYANGTLFAYGELIEQEGKLVVRVTDLAETPDKDSAPGAA
ncbi:FliM/FliN family flagellar motor switch protein [Pacificimonas sp. WHA3]|uniref:FliM/FliN family flagellar motor switch protein n=1 Tax=Pacificimonas pallii TaxID=2827236 RepID=A0ABS6SFG6_9SPHN|nr:FliM/FliN family flagellar motor switch protein [Pacificimonas pallii]MBV7256995.1 FliM/FliN family flagellar motor switch protein [Pacificimonas pallii]